MSERACDTEPAVAYLLGVPRSGTTLLAHLLARHPAVLCPPEPWLMLALQSFGAVPAGHPGDPDLVRTATANLLGRARVEILGRAAEAIYQALLSRDGKQLLIDKTPRYYHCLRFIKAAMPRAKFIWIRRNPLDVAASYKTTWNVDVPLLIGERCDDPNFFDFAVGFRLLADFAAANEVCTVAYEDLVRDPQSQLARVFDHLDLPPCDLGEPKLDSGVHRPGQLGDQKIFHTRSVHSNAVGTFRSVLCPEEIQAILTGLGRDLFARLGYQDSYDQALRSVGGSVRDLSEATYKDAVTLLRRRLARDRATNGAFVQRLRGVAARRRLWRLAVLRKAIARALRTHRPQASATAIPEQR
jgi:hypothetical protein